MKLALPGGTAAGGFGAAEEVEATETEAVVDDAGVLAATGCDLCVVSAYAAAPATTSSTTTTTRAVDLWRLDSLRSGPLSQSLPAMTVFRAYGISRACGNAAIVPTMR